MAREAAEVHLANPTAESRAKYFQVCLPLFRARSTDPEAGKRAIMNDDAALRFNGVHNEQGRMDFRADLARIRCPVLILAGDRDPIMPMAFSETIAACLPPHLGRFERFANCGHGVFQDDPGRAFAVLRDFIQRPAETS